ncbi:hypothetical protein E2C01_001479 [Portunus trituberculatus]|uniref:Uncharacterized protein n=1 Tax=Portunus trituberculatus TaxID=210409 RepID=A0A5B7CJI2_PORTR|nr:hypothetical protein [Portunus trituberculatus]
MEKKMAGEEKEEEVMGDVAVMGSRSVRGVIPSAAPLVPSLLGVAPTFGGDCEKPEGRKEEEEEEEAEEEDG